MKKLIYTGAFALTALFFTACSGEAEELENAADDIEMTEDESISEEKTEEMNKAIELQEDAEKLDEEMDAFIKTLKN